MENKFALLVLLRELEEAEQRHKKRMRNIDRDYYLCMALTVALVLVAVFLG